jgi:hypothetical protein
MAAVGTFEVKIGRNSAAEADAAGRSSYNATECSVFVLGVYSPLINSGRVYSQLKVEQCFCTHSSTAW